MPDYPRILTAGDSALVVEFGNAIDPSTNRAVYAFASALEAARTPAVRELVPTYRSVLVHYDPLELPCADLTGRLSALLADLDTSDEAATTARLYRIPVAYGGDHGPDLGRVAEHAGLTPAEVIEIHSATAYPVYMLGFLPGFPYLGGMDPRIACPRLTTPRVRVPAGSVGIAESQTGVYPMDSPGGWNLIGHTPVRLFNPAADPPVLIQPGAYIRFEPIDAAGLARIREQIAAGTYAIPAEDYSP